MKKLIIYSLLLIGFTACMTDHKEYYNIKVLDVYLDSTQNQNLGRNLMGYNYADFLRKSTLNLNEHELSGVSWRIVQLDSSKKDVVFQIGLSKQSLQKKDQIQKFFTEFIDEKIQFQTTQDSLVETALQFSDHMITYLDEDKMPYFWEHTAELFKDRTNSENFKHTLKRRLPTDQHVEGRYIQSYQYYKGLENGQKGTYLAINYAFKEQEGYEQITLKAQDTTFKIIGYLHNF